MKDHGQDSRPARQARSARPERRLIVLGIELDALAQLVGDRRFQQSLRRQRHPARNTRPIHGR